MQHKLSIGSKQAAKIITLFVIILTFSHISKAEHTDLSKVKTLYTVATAHLDTQWRWTVKTTINEYLTKTLDTNFSYFESYPDYNFSFEGPFRYMLIKEYYPERYDIMSKYIANGRWNVGGTTLENGDMNVVSPESLIRQALIGNNYFEDEFGKRSTDIFLPDCFGFSYTMPTWASHCGINGFSSQKLSWGGIIPAPFSVGVWKGPDGSSIIAALKPGSYGGKIETDLSNDSKWLERINQNGENYGLFADYHYFGTGDTGGAPAAESCEWLEKSISGNGPVKVLSAGSDDLYNDITPEQKAKLPVYDGELLMRIHGTGCYTAQAAMKRWNRQNELLADSAERASVIADWFGAAKYPQKNLDDAWIRFLWHSFHDDLTGTSIPEAYNISWNDEILSLNQFSSILDYGVGSIAQALDTAVKGKPVIVFNPLGISRQDITEATISYETTAPEYIKVYNGSKEVPSQIISRNNNSISIAFIADAPSVGFNVFDVRSSKTPCKIKTGLKVTTSTLENKQFLVKIDQNGDIASIWDKQAKKEILAAPSRLELLPNYSPEWPAWEIRYEDLQKQPMAYVSGPTDVKIIDNGPARVSLQITRTYGDKEKSTFIQTFSLASGNAGGQVNVTSKIDWRAKGTLLKASFPLTAKNPNAAYDLGMGTIERGNNKENIYEVPAQQWADITNNDNSFGTSILNDSRYGWDKPADNILRLTLLHTPSVDKSYTDQTTLDHGQHILTYAIAPHTGNWIDGDIPNRAARLNQPLITYQSDKHSGKLGKQYSFLQVDNPNVFVKAVKKAQRTDELVIRFQEQIGSTASNVLVNVGNGIKSAREVNGCERDIAPASVVNGKLKFSMTKYQPKTFALILEKPSIITDSVSTARVNLPFNIDAFSFDSDKANGDFVNGFTYPAELISDSLDFANINYKIGTRLDNNMNALSCSGQTINLGSQDYESLYILAASKNGDINGEFNISGNTCSIKIQDYHKNIADWGREEDAPYIKNDTVAWVGTHRHSPEGNQAYEFCYLFQYKIELPKGAKSITLPDNEDIVIFAMTLANVPANSTTPASEKIDKLPYLPELASKPETRNNLAWNKPVHADSFNPNEEPENIVDGERGNNSKWCVNDKTNNAHWLVLDLEKEYTVDTFVIRHAGNGSEPLHWNTCDFCIQTSPNGNDNWSNLVDVKGNSKSVSRHIVDPVKVRYLRLYITKPAQDDNTAVRIYEFEVYGK